MPPSHASALAYPPDYLSHTDIARTAVFLLGQRRISPQPNITQKQFAGFGGGSYLTYRAAFAKYLVPRGTVSRTGDFPSSAPASLWAIGLALLLFTGCNALNPLCGSARPAPVMGSLSASTITFAQVQQGFVLTVNGSDFVSSSVVIINGTTLTTTVQSSQKLQVTITTSLISGPGSANVTVNTPSGNSGYLGCTSGGTTSALTLTIT